MEKFEISNLVENKIKEMMMGECTGHDWWHIKRVLDMAVSLNNKIGANEFVVKMIALLHDVFDDKFSDGNTEENLKKLLREIGVLDIIQTDDLENIIFSVSNLGFKGGFSKVRLSIEGQIVQDADRIDALGAVGIARVFAYGGKKGREIYNPDVGIIELANESEYRNLNRHSVNHFYEKLLTLKDTLNTDEAIQIAEKRTEYMQEFLNEFYAEWNGEK